MSYCTAICSQKLLECLCIDANNTLRTRTWQLVRQQLSCINPHSDCGIGYAHTLCNFSDRQCAIRKLSRTHLCRSSNALVANSRTRKVVCELWKANKIQ